MTLTDGAGAQPHFWNILSTMKEGEKVRIRLVDRPLMCVPPQSTTPKAGLSRFARKPGSAWSTGDSTHRTSIWRWWLRLVSGNVWQIVCLLLHQNVWNADEWDNGDGWEIYERSFSAAWGTIWTIGHRCGEHMGCYEWAAMVTAALEMVNKSAPPPLPFWFSLCFHFERALTCSFTLQLPGSQSNWCCWRKRSSAWRRS